MEPWYYRKTRKFNWTLLAVSLLSMIYPTFGDVSFLQGVLIFFTGLGLCAASGFTLQLSYGKVPENEVFWTQIFLRAGYILACLAASAETYFVEKGWELALGLLILAGIFAFSMIPVWWRARKK